MSVVTSMEAMTGQKHEASCSQCLFSFSLTSPLKLHCWACWPNTMLIFEFKEKQGESCKLVVNPDNLVHASVRQQSL